MTTATLILLATGTLVGAGWFLTRRQRRQTRADRLRAAASALDGCAELLGLVRALQQHRGLSSGWLAGERSFEPRMLERRQDVENRLRDLARCATLESAMPRPCLTPNDLALFRFRWRELTAELAALGIDAGIACHSQLIARALDWLAALGEARVKLTLPQSASVDLACNYADRLPQLAECLGQLRALGSGAAAAGRCSPVARVRLRYLAARSDALLAEARDATRDPRAAAAGAAVQDLLDTVRQALLEATTVEMAAEAYFTTATRAIDAVYAWIDASGAEVRRALADATRDAGSRPAAVPGGWAAS